MTWMDHFKLGSEPSKRPSPEVFTDKEHSIAVLAERYANGFPVLHPDDSFLFLIHDHIGLLGDDRRSNGTDKPAEISPFGEVVDDEASELSAAEADLELWHEQRKAQIRGKL